MCQRLLKQLSNCVSLCSSLIVEAKESEREPGTDHERFREFRLSGDFSVASSTGRLDDTVLHFRISPLCAINPLETVSAGEILPGHN